jgi:osmotically-inducible protein OsmY
MARSRVVTSGNERIAEDVRAELRADPAVPDDGIEVHVHHGTVHLRGSVPGLLQKQQALHDAHGVRGVRDVVDELGVELPERWVRPDGDVEDAVRDVLRHHAAVPGDAVTVRAHRGSVTLHGSVEHNYQRRAAVAAAGAVWGVRDVVDRVILRPVADPVDVLDRIRAALLRNALLEHAQITVAVDGEVVTLSGTVGVRGERQEAERVAWAVPGVVEVHDQLVIEPRQA